MAAPNRKLLGNTIAREQFLLNEARIMAQLRLEGMSADEAARKVAFDGYMTAADALLTLVEEGVEAAMRTFNRKPPKADANGPQAAAREDT